MGRAARDKQKDSSEIHHHYMDILNCVSDVVYWVDVNCKLIGCNRSFVQLLGLKKMKDFVGTPYEQMTKFTKWSPKRIEAFKLDDMGVLFSGVPEYGVIESPVYNEKGDAAYYLATRVPLFDKHKKVNELVVVLRESAQKIDTPIESLPLNSEVSLHKEAPMVLMVEDNFIAQQVEEALLKALHCQVDIAESGDKALELFIPGKYDIVLMDIGLQDTSGYMVSKKIRQMEKETQHHVPIIALTSYQADVVQYDCYEYFMDGVLTKPLTSEQAQQIIQHYIFHENVVVNGLKSADQLIYGK